MQSELKMLLSEVSLYLLLVLHRMLADNEGSVIVSLKPVESSAVKHSLLA